jgi:hypothetical protein
VLAITRQKLFQKYFKYDNGKIYWKEKSSYARSIEIGSEAGFLQPGDRTRPPYKAVRLLGKHYYIHRVIYEMYNGDTKLQVDHIDRNSLNNVLENLRAVTILQNVRNSSEIYTNTSGYRGVSWHKKIKKWHAQSSIAKKKIHLGYYDTKEEAHNAYKIFREGIE